MMKVSLPILSLSVAIIFSGCDCGRRGSVTQTYGEIGVVWVTDEGIEVADRDATYDFGTATMGDRVPKLLIIRNLSSGPLTLQMLERTEGDAVTIADKVEERAAFEVKFGERTLAAGEETTMDMYFTPPQALDATVSKEAHLAKLLLTAGGTHEEENSAVITLKGNAEAGSCLLPSELDFGAVPVGETFAYPFALKNETSTPVNGFAGAPESTTGDHLAFGYSDGSPRGEFPIAANGAANLQITFAPTEMRAYSATVKLRAGPGCPEGTITLKGEGVDSVLSWTPTELDYGYVSPGTIVSKQVMFTNLSKVAITLTQVQTSLSSDFQVKPEIGNDSSTFTVPGGGTPVPMNVLCKPATLGQRSATLTFQTGLQKTPTGTINLKCFGGGPDIKVTPSPDLVFGVVPYFAGQNSAVTRRVVVQNVGTLPPGASTDGNLKLGSIANGVPGQLPYVALTPSNAATEVGEFSVGIPPTYDATKGIEATVGKNSLDLQIKISPKSVGQKEALLTIFSNDPDEPETKIRVTADVQVLPPCTYTVTPSNLNFGLVPAPSFKELPFTIKNTGTNGCDISSVDIGAGSDSAYSIVGGAIPSKHLNTNEELTVVVRSNPLTTPANNATASLTGNVTFSVNAPGTAPKVQLLTSVGPSCLTVAPDVLDFGTVKKGCSSSTRSFSAYNTCSQDIYIQGISVSVPAGEPAGGPNCAGTSACPEFKLVSTPTIPSGGLRVQPGSTGTSFQAKYSPINYGADQGAIAISVIQSGQPVTYLVTLSGSGDATGAQTDSFTQDLHPKADILLVIDNSGSMDDKQQALANNFSAFLQYANSAGVDYHLAVTTTDIDDGGCIYGICTPEGQKGKLIGDANNPKVLTPVTPNVGTLYSQKVKVGTNGSGYEKGIAGATLALTPPLISNENAGFLRQDARLAVVVVSDAEDQSPQSLSYYLNLLMNVKGFNRASDFTFSVIGPYQSQAPSGCTYDGVSPDTRYAYIANSTKGVLAEICNSNWATTLQGLGQTAFGYRTSFFLNATPSLTNGATITVQIDGTTIPATSGSTTNWSYDSAANAITFDPAHVPSPGQTLTVSYTVACL